MSVGTGKENNRFHYLDGLRAIAILLVFFHHTFSFSELLSNRGLNTFANFIKYTGGSGVELFFVLSGVVLIRPYLRGLRKFDFRKYYLRRFSRIYPPYIVAWLIAGGVKIISSYFPNWYSQETLPYFSFVDWLKQLSILNVFEVTYYNGAWWSLSIEVLFYLLIPISINILTSERANIITLCLFMFISLLIAAFCSDLILHTNSYLFKIQLSFLIYLPCFIGGITIAKFDFHRIYSYILIAIGICYLCISLLYPSLNIHNSYALLYTGVVSLVFTEATLINKMLSHPLLVWIGERSYSFFLIHYTVFNFTRHLVALFTHRSLIYYFITRLIEIPLAILASLALFHFVERHFAKNLATANFFLPSKQMRIY